MTSQFEYSQIASQEDIARLGNILEQCFLMSPGESKQPLPKGLVITNIFQRTGLKNQ